MKQKQAHLSRLGTGLFSFLCIVYVLPIVVVLMNSFKKKSYISLEPFQLPNETTLTGLDNYTAAIDQYGFLDAVGWTVFITVGSVLVILICTSMCAWYITRVKTRVTKAIYILCVFSMVVPFQMVMFTLSLSPTGWVWAPPGVSSSSTWALARGWRCSCSAALSSPSPLRSRRPP